MLEHNQRDFVIFEYVCVLVRVVKRLDAGARRCMLATVFVRRRENQKNYFLVRKIYFPPQRSGGKHGDTVTDHGDEGGSMSIPFQSEKWQRSNVSLGLRSRLIRP